LARRDLTNKQFAALIGENEMWVSRRVRGHTQLTFDDIERAATALDVPLGYFLDGVSAA
jgi:transcriptional regulator with XRE-family HTH domain